MSRTRTIGAAAFGALCLCTAVACPSAARAARAPSAAETKAVSASVRAFWCKYLTKAQQPCGIWSAATSGIRVSTVKGEWAVAHARFRNGRSGEVVLENQFVHRTRSGWRSTGWFLTVAAPSCPKAAKLTRVPEPVLQDLGICDQLVRVP